MVERKIQLQDDFTAWSSEGKTIRAVIVLIALRILNFIFWGVGWLLQFILQKITEMKKQATPQIDQDVQSPADFIFLFKLFSNPLIMSSLPSEGSLCALEPCCGTYSVLLVPIFWSSSHIEWALGQYL